MRIGLGMFAAVAVAIGSATASAYPADEPRVELRPLSATSVASGTISFSFELFDGANKTALSDADLAITHEKKIHFVAYDDALGEFQHVHPQYAGGVWSVALEFARAGHYRVWAQGQIAADGEEFAAVSEVDVSGGLPANPAPPALGDSRTGSDQGSMLALSAGKLHAGRMEMLTMRFSRVDGSTPVLSDYLGAPAHVTAVSTDGEDLVHVHPMATAKPNELMLHATFTEPGAYRIWIEFIDGGVLKRVPLSVQVVK